MNDVGREHRQPHRPGDLARPYGLFLGGLFLPPPMHSRFSVDPSKEFAKKVVFQAKKARTPTEDVREEVIVG